MTEWKEYKLGEVIKTNVESIGKDYPYSKILYLDTGSITRNNIDQYQEFELDKAPSRAKRLVKQDDIIYSSVRPNQLHYGYITNPANNLVVSTGFVTITCNKAYIEPKFLYYYLTQENITEYLHSVAEASTSAYPSLKPSDIEFLDISLPPLPEQKRIASILSSLDDKIDLLHRENKTLEAMAETLFRKWFIEEAKEDWEEVSLEYVCERITDGSHYSPESVESGLPMASVKDMEDWGINLNSCRKISKEEFDKLVSADCLPQVNDILIAKDGSYLKHIFVVNKMQEVVILSSIAIIRPNGLYHPYLLSLLLKLDSIKEELKNIVTGAVIPRIVLKDFRKFPIILPPKEKQEKALLFIEPIMKKCFYNREQIQTLTQTRDGLLPKLMSGEVKI